MLTSRQIRQQFLDYFVKKCAHTYVPSSPVVPHGDPTLLFTNAGMNQFKDVFLGLGSRDYTRAVDTQKCIRAGGKHNDLEDVGKDTYHHTFFEMLGNWSFGDYFKTEAIDWAWDLLVNVWKMDATRLHATYFKGDPASGLDPDTEARDIWLRYLPADRVHPGNMKDNFWEMGDTGPCGPCSEIHVDLTPDKSGSNLVNKGDPRVIEIWNLVFMQFNRNADRSLAPLPARHVDTGMGFERLAAVLQGKTSNYDTDVFAPLFAAIREITGAPEYSGTLHSGVDVAYRVIADHARTLTFAITDGALPSNEGRGYVLRRILRRAVRYGRQTLNQAEPFLYKLVPIIVEQMSDVFPELRDHPDRVAQVIREEELSFGRTLDRGIQLFNDAAVAAEQTGSRAVSAADAFKLYDTYGFPLDLTVLMAQERDMKVDTDGFEALMNEARQRSRAEAGQTDSQAESLLNLVQQGKLSTTQFLGYDQLITEDGKTVQLLALTDDRYQLADSLRVGQPAALVVEATPFYAESGGQVGDTGTIHSRHGAVFRVENTTRIGDVTFHLGQLEEGSVRKDEPAFSGKDVLVLEVDTARRRKIMAHHTTTHLLNWALRETLGDHIQQKGSLVDDTKTRFDFSHTGSLSPDELQQIQKLVNDRIAQNLTVYTHVAPQEDALKINGLRAVFGEKYPPKVRVVSIGAPVSDLLANPDDPKWRQFSVEFCGGTHLRTTAAAEHFVILSEEGVAKGVRRITALAGDAAARANAHAGVLHERIEALSQNKPESLEQDLASITEAINTAPLPALARTDLRNRIADLQKAVKDYRKQLSKQSAEEVVEAARALADQTTGPILVAEIPSADPDTLRTAMDVIRKKKPDAAMLLAAVSGDKVSLIASVPAPLIEKGLKAGDWVREAAKVTGGGGGGKPEMAQAGGKDPTKLPAALEAARQFAAVKIGQPV